MTARNDITGDKIQSRVSTQEFEDNWERTFRKATLGDSETPPDKPVEPPAE
jgi:hypothetical protein